MAFDLNNLGRWSISYNTIAPTEWGYNGNKGTVADNLDVITADGYFNDAPDSYFRVGDVLYITALPISSVFASDQTVTIQSLDPIVVRPINGLSPIFTVINNVATVAAPVGTVQNFALPGLKVGDFPLINITGNPLKRAIVSVNVIIDTFIIEFNFDPGPNLTLEGLFFRQSFS